jgi:RNA polymerase subunit RPABC4/transcription elongation factor Spt4
MEDPSPPPGIPLTCTSCGSPIEPGHKFCNICGTKVEELPVCRKCGALFLAPVKFCELCGTPVMAQEPAQVEEQGPEPEVETEPEDEPVVEPEIPELVAEPKVIEPEPFQPKHTPVKVSPPVEEREIAAEPEPAPLIREDEAGPAPKKSPVNLLLIGGGIIILLMVIAGVYFIGLPILQGDTAIFAPSQPPAPVNTPAPPPTTLPATMPTLIPTPVPATPDNSLIPQETQQIPKNQEVFFDVQKDGVTNQITTLYQRGPGENILSYAEVKVTHPDGTVETGTITPSLGETELTLDGSRQTDRVEVIAYMYTGQDYRVKDELMT